MNDKIVRGCLLFCATVSVFAIILITVMIFMEAFPALKSQSIFDFIFGVNWNANQNQFGIFPMILGTLYATAVALIIGIPIGIATAIFMTDIASPKIAVVMRRAIEILAGIPSVIYGFFALVVIVPAVRNLGGTGMSILSAGIILAIMILPTLISVSENALRAVPQEYKEGSLALGASEWQSIVKVKVPAARSGILASVILAAGRAIGETMAVILVAGNIPAIPNSILDPVRTLTVNIVLEMGYIRPGTLHYSALFLTAAVLFVFIMLLNWSVRALLKERKEKKHANKQQA